MTANAAGDNGREGYERTYGKGGQPGNGLPDRAAQRQNTADAHHRRAKKIAQRISRLRRAPDYGLYSRR